MRSALTLLLVSVTATPLVAACSSESPSDESGASATTVKPDNVGLGDPSDARYVIRRRVLFEKDRASFSVEGEPFSHQARVWHSYPLTVYPGATIGVRFKVNDPEMRDRASVRLYGPIHSDGSLAAPKTTK